MYLMSARRWVKRLEAAGIDAYIAPGPRRAGNGKTLARVIAVDREGNYTTLRSEAGCQQFQESYSRQAEGTDATAERTDTVHCGEKHHVGVHVPQRRKYADPAERMRAYRQRRKERESGAANPGTPRRWIRELNDVQQSMRAYYLARTERWREGDRGEALDDILGKLEDVIADLEAM